MPRLPRLAACPLAALLLLGLLPAAANDVLPAGRTALGRGAAVPWVTYEAEHGTPKGGAQVIGSPLSRKLGTWDGEASGRRAVVLEAEGASIEWSAAAAAHGLVLRVSIPDAPGGGGLDATLGLYVNGARKASIAVTSRHAWLYGDDFTQGDDPARGGARKLYDESRLLFQGFAVAPGDLVMLRKDAQDRAARYAVDFLELEAVPAPLGKPAGYVSIADHGAVPDDGNDDDEAIRKAVAAVQAGQGSGVWIPPGLWRQGAKIRTRRVKVQGAGMWHSRLYCPAPGVEPDGGFTGFVLEGDGGEFRDFAISGWGGTRDQGGKAFMGPAFQGTVLERLWIEHVECGFWAGGGSGSTGLLIKDCRFRNTGADAVNLCNGNLDGVIDNCHARHTGDDAFAVWSARDLYAQPCVNNVIRNSTVQLPWRAACFAVYGGRGNRIENCLGQDALTYPGLTVSTEHNPYPLESATVDGLTLVRCGGQYWSPPQQFGAVWLHSLDAGFRNVTVRNVTIIDPTFQGIHLQSGNGHAMAATLLENITIVKPATYGIQIKDGSLGTATFRNINVGVSNAAHTLVNQAPGSFTAVQQGVGNAVGVMARGRRDLTARAAARAGCDALGRAQSLSSRASSSSSYSSSSEAKEMELASPPFSSIFRFSR